jgi:hypothetical protein
MKYLELPTNKLVIFTVLTTLTGTLWTMYNSRCQNTAAERSGIKNSAGDRSGTPGRRVDDDKE